MELTSSVVFNSTEEALNFYLDHEVNEGNFADMAKQMEISRDMKLTGIGRKFLAMMIERVTLNLSVITKIGMDKFLKRKGEKI